MEKNLEYLKARVMALENELSRIKSQNEFLKAENEVLKNAIDEAYLFI